MGVRGGFVFVGLLILMVGLGMAKEIEVINLSNNATLNIDIVDAEYERTIPALFLIVDWVSVLVDIKDISNISISAEDRKNTTLFDSKINEKKAILGNITYSVLENLSENEFRLDRISSNGKWFSGNISKNGFDKLLSDSRIEKIHDNTLEGSLDSVVIFKKLFLYFFIVIFLLLLFLLFLLYRRRKKK